MTDQYAVIGSPIGHSLSPRIHAAFAEQTGERLDYGAIEITPEDFFHRVNQLQDEGFHGLNVTVPLKGLAWETADGCSDHANRAQAVNTLRFEADSTRYGFNTDGIGLLRDLTGNHGLTLDGKRILILGAGGAVRGVLAPLLQQHPRQLVIANRTASKAVQLAESFSDLGPVEGCGLGDLGEMQYELIINATSAGLSDTVPPLPPDVLADDGAAYDMVYAREPTAFVRWARQHGARVSVDGLGMLVEQAAESFRLWRGVKPDTGPVLRMLRNS